MKDFSNGEVRYAPLRNDWVPSSYLRTLIWRTAPLEKRLAHLQACDNRRIGPHVSSRDHPVVFSRAFLGGFYG